MACERAAQQGFTLLAQRRRRTDEQQGVAKHHHTVVRPKPEMSDPQLLVDAGHELLHLGQAQFRCFHFEGVRKVQNLNVINPGERNAVVGPASSDQNRYFLLAYTFKRPIVVVCQSSDYIERIIALVF